MKKIGCGLFLIGMALFVVAFVMFGATIKAATESNRVKAFPMTLGEAVKTGPVTVNTDRFCQVTVKARMTVTNVEAKKRFDKTEYEGNYHFPLTYRVTDADGKLVHEQTTAVNSDQGTRINHSASLNEKGGTVSVEQCFDKFQAPGPVQVEATLQPDAQYGATLQDGRLIVYDNVSKHGQRIMGGVVLFFGGPALGVVGIGVFVLGLFTGGKKN
jgi:hypothetical protein